MKKYLLAIAMLVMAGTIAIAGVTTGVFGNNTVRPVHDDEIPQLGRNAISVWIAYGSDTNNPQ